MPIITSLDAGLTDTARRIRARKQSEAIVLGDWSFKVGDEGFQVDPTLITAIDYSQNDLTSPLGSNRPLGELLASGTGASLTVESDGFVLLDSISPAPTMVPNTWVRITGSADPDINGTYPVAEAVSSTSVRLYHPLAPSDDAGPLNWEVRRSCVQNPNAEAEGFYCALDRTDATVDGNTIGQIGIFCRVLSAPSDASLVGDEIMYAVCHRVELNKFDGMAVSVHVCVQN